MKTLRQLILLLTLGTFFQQVYAQEFTSRTDQIMKEHIEQFKSDLIVKDREIFVQVEYDVSKFKLEDARLILPGLAGYKLPKAFFLIKFLFIDGELRALHFNVKRKGKKKFFLTNMGNGAHYEI